MERKRDRLPAVCLIFIFFSNVILAQQAVTSATLSGRTEDSSGAILSGASVTMTNLETNRQFKVLTDEAGRYHFAYLPSGNYRLSAEHSGFAVRSLDLTLTIGQTLYLPLVLGVTGVTENVNVTDAAPLIETARTQVAETIVPQEIDRLPLNGRNYLDLAALTPGVTRTNPVANQRFPETSAVPGTGLSITGQRFINNGFVVDGLSANDDAADLPATFYSQEVIKEFQVITSGGVAEYGRASGGYLNIATQSGGNDWRGRVYGFLRNRRFDARNPLAQAKDPLTQAQYGGSLSGPLKMDRTFLFASFEQTRLHNATVITISPANAAVINHVLEAINHQNAGGINTGLVPTGFNASNVFVRLDHRLNEANNLTARYSLYDINSINARSVGGLNAISRGTALQDRDQTGAFNLVSTISPRIFNEARFQFTHSRLAAPVNDEVGPAINISGVANLGTSTSSPTRRDLNTTEVVDNISFHRGAHALKAGVDFLLNRVNIAFPGALQGVYTFSSLANFQNYRYVTFQQAFGPANQFQNNPNVGFFTQDEWRPRSDLTINAGLRYDEQFLPAPIKTDVNNFAPRLGIAYAPWDSRTVLRASYGIYFDRLPLRAVSNALQRDGTKYKVAVLSFGQIGAPAFPATLAAFPQTLLTSITTIDPQIKNAYSQQASAQIERELSSGMSVSAGYLHVRGLHLTVSRNINVPTVPASAGVPNLGRPDSRFANISRYESSGDSYYNGLIVSFKRRFAKWAEMRLAYTYSKSIDDAGNAFFFTPQNNLNLRDDRGLSENDQRHRLALSGYFSSPFRASHSGWTHKLLADTQLSYIFQYGSKLPFNIMTGTDRNFDTNVNDRPLGVGRNTGQGFNYASLDLRLSKRIHFGEHTNLEVIAEGFNVLNRANLQLPNGVYGAGVNPLPSFGLPTAADNPRQVQLGLRFSF